MDEETRAQFDLFAACPRGLETALVEELRALGGADCRALGGGVRFRGDRTVAYAANLWSRLASRVMRAIAQRRYRNDDDLYRLANGVEWERLFDARRTLRVDVSAQRSPLRSLNFATLRIKDGIVDRLRTVSGERPSIDTRSPDVRVFAHLDARDATLYLDLSGEPLFKRGWRSGTDDKGSAPLKENLAAGLLALARWTPAMPLCDPFCGSGTIAIEAAQRAFDVAPGSARSFGFERLLDHEAALWSRLRDDAALRARSAVERIAGDADLVRIAGSDVDRDSIARARRNLVRAGIPEGAVQWRVLDAGRARAPFGDPGVVVTNPPYGERLQAQASTPPDGASRHEAAMRAFGVALKKDFAGWRVWVLSSDPELPRQLGMQEKRRTPLFNGAIECRLFGFEVFGPREGRPTPGTPSPR